MSAPVSACADFLGGFVAGEGCFTRTGNRFRFAVALGATDTSSCELLADVLGCGSVHTYPRRQAHYDDEVVFAVQRLRDLVEIVVPFMDEHLPASSKRDQYGVWRAELLDYWTNDAKRDRGCAVEGCDAPHRAHGLCRRHLYEEERR